MKTNNPKTRPMTRVLAALGLAGAVSLIGTATAQAAAAISNPSFEANSFIVFPGYHHQAGNGAIVGWTPSGGAGLNPSAGSPFADNGTIPNGSQVAFIQNGVDASLSTVITDLTPGTTYKVNFRVNARNGNTANLKVDVDGTDIINTGITSVGGANAYKYFAVDFTATAASQTLRLRNNAGGDNTVVLDDFSIAPRNSGWSYAAWNDETTSGVDNTKTYTHAYNFGSAASATISGVTFTGVTGGNPSVVNKFSASGLANVFNGDGNNLNDSTRAMANDFLYGGPSQSITITGLELGAEYVATIYSVGWENGTRAATFSVGSDRLTVNQDHFGDNNGIAFSYRYIATDVSVTLNFNQLEGNSIHVYGFSNYELAAPPVPVIVNPSFEVDAVPAFPGYGPISGWTGGSGINGSGGPFHDNGVIPNGAKIAFLQSDGPLSQMVSGFIPGVSYQISYFENSRNCCSGTSPFAEVKVGGNTVVTAHAVPPVGGANPYHQRVSDPFTATASTMEVAIIKSNPQGGDTTLLVDNVTFLASGTAPTITVQPQGQTVGAGTSLTLTVAAIGSAPLAYQWIKDGGEIIGANNSSYEISPVFHDDAGVYTVRVSNGAGNVLSANATIVVRDPVNTAFNTGVDSTGAALPDGSADPHYTLVVNPNSPGNTTAVVQDSTVFPIVTGPWFANNGGSKWIGPDLNTSGSAGATGSGGDYVYRTLVDLTGFEPGSVVITGGWATDNEGLDIIVNGVSTGLRNTAGFPSLTPFTISSGLLAGVNKIEFKLNNASVGYTGLRIDNVRALGTALPPGTPPSIVEQPQTVTETLGQRVTFSARANGSPDITYQWYFGLDAIFDATGSELSFQFDFPDQAGEYSVEVTSPFGTLRSSVAQLVYRDVPLVITQPQSIAVGIGDPATFSVVANGEEPLIYQWFHNGVEISGASSATLSIAAASLSDAGNYTVRISNFAGEVDSNVAVLSVLERVPGLFNTGVGEDAVSLPSGTLDPHWTIVQSPDTAFPGPNAYVLNDSGFPIPPWLANDEISKWIAPQADQSGGNLEGDYKYRTMFSLAGFNPATVVVVGEWSTDNAGKDILINGTSTGQINSGQFAVWTPFSVTGGFVAGVNTLDFLVNNAPTAINPTGFRVRNIRILGVRVAPPTIACPGNQDVGVQVDGPTAVQFAATATDATGAALTVNCTPASGSLFPMGQTTVTCSTTDRFGGSASCSFIVTVRLLNQPPTAKLDTDALVDFSPDFENPVLISCNWWNACLILDGSLSSDPDQDALSYLWFVEPSPVPFAGGPVATNCLEVGTHTIVLTVTDTKGATDSDSKTIEVVTAPLAIELLMEKVNESLLIRSTKRELLAVLRTALNQAKNERIRPTQTTLDAFEKKVRAKVVTGYPEEAAAWIRWSQAISSGMEECIKAPVVKKQYHGNKGGEEPPPNDQQPN